MLRRVIALLLLAAIGCGFYYWSHEKNETVSSLNVLIERLSNEVDSNDLQSAQKSTDEIKQIFEEKQDLFNITNNHEFINTLSDYVSEIEVAIKNDDKSRLETAIAYLKNHINDFYNDSKIKLSNII